MRGRRALTAPRLLHASAIHPHVDLDGLPLATPRQRGLALAFDAALLVVPTVAVAILFGAAALAIREPAAFAALRAVTGGADTPDQERIWREQLARLLVRYDADGVPPVLALAVEQGDLARAAAMLEPDEVRVHVSLGDGDGSLGPREMRLHLENMLPSGLRAASVLGVAALYFTLLTAGGRRTLGKRLVGTRVLKLDGQPLTVWESFERFGGYFAALGTFGLGLQDLWREPNSRMAHDRMSNTVVVTTQVVSVALFVDAPAARR
jgi:hypothetical protein